MQDVVSFTKLSVALKTSDLVDMLNELYTSFDVLVEKHCCYKARARAAIHAIWDQGQPIPEAA